MEEELTNAKADLTVSFDRKSVLKEELTRVKTEHEKALKWTIFSQTMTNYFNQESSNGRDLGGTSQKDYHSKEMPSSKTIDHRKKKSFTTLKRRKQRLPR